jgi:glycosyltransferase involved in cell wall biosynthesis
MEERKGVRVILRAAVELIQKINRSDIHFLLLGNRNGEERDFESLYRNTMAEQYITFGGYRNDLDCLLRSCHGGIIASTGWDSFTMSALEMASSGLPLLVSDLQGLVETVDDQKTGFLFKTGDHADLAQKIVTLCKDTALHATMSKNARKRVEEKFTMDRQIHAIITAITNAYHKTG